VGSYAFGNFSTLQIDQGATWTLTGANAIANVVNNGVCSISGSLTVTSAVDPASSGEFALMNSSSLEVASCLGAQSSIAFIGGGDQLTIDSWQSFGSLLGSPNYAGPQLEDFGAGDSIDLRNFSVAGASYAYNSATGLLQIANSAGQAATLDFQNSTLGGSTFQIASDGGSGLLLTH
jgi:hypothetical protein